MIQFDNCIKYYKKIILDELKDAGITCWIAGGCLRDWFMGIPSKTDIDIFFPDEANRARCEGYLRGAGAEILFENDNALKVKYKGKKYDVIFHLFATPQETIEAFDFTVSMFAVDSEKIYHGETSFIDLSKRQLMINKLPYPASTLSRAFRYYKKGFGMCTGEMKKLVEAIQNMPKPEVKTDDNGEEIISSPENTFIGID